jgi:hypothetical protein
MACARGGNTICLIIGRRQPSIGWAEERYVVDLGMFRKFRSLVIGIGEAVQIEGDFGIDAVDCGNPKPVTREDGPRDSGFRGSLG